jgi:hypothetical protein
MRNITSGRLAAMAAAAALAAVPAVAAATPATPAHAIAAGTCSSGYTHARIDGVQKCLRRGEFCAHAYDHRAPHRYSYAHYGFACKSRDSSGNYHLTSRY